MKKPSSIALLLLVPIVIFVTPSTSAAQQPKMDIKLFVGGSATTFVSMLESGRERETFAGWQIGFGPRVRRRHAFIEILFSFNRWAFAFSDPVVGAFTGRVNSFELPFNMGYIPYKNPFFKLFLYAGYVNHFNTKIIAEIEGGSIKRSRASASTSTWRCSTSTSTIRSASTARPRRHTEPATTSCSSTWRTCSRSDLR
jgi:hypothetical protein